MDELERAAHARLSVLIPCLSGLNEVLLGSGFPIQVVRSLALESLWYTFPGLVAASSVTPRLEARYGVSFSACRKHSGSPVGRHH